MVTPSSSKPLSRQKLATLLRATGKVFSVDEAAAALELPRGDTAKKLARWAESGWLNRVRRGLYIPVPVESVSGDTVAEDSWVLAEAAFSPCYIGGWSAAQHWDLTEQIFRTVIVYSTAPPRDRRPKLVGTDFWVIGTNSQRMFGLKPLWRERTKVQISDPARTLVDILDNPATAGGLRQLNDILIAYLDGPQSNTEQLISHAETFGSGAVFKRLGFLVERAVPKQTVLLDACQRNLTVGLAKLDPALECDRIVKRWRVRVPSGWVSEP